ncbi:MAG TPA: hypothetical protein DCZ94_06910 [Lentisphaeria bacterium]|nr:MAG: hypothetical protein A2X48_10475 [Lentisphaerae bacterium GWF2_49_21]HBC86664.1 hypothetical protein [Lentisphaeria bacterium]
MGLSSHEYTLDKSTGEIKLPHNVLHELFHIYREIGEEEAVKRVIELTGADIKTARTFVAQLSRRR